MSDLRIRSAARAVVLDPDDRILLVRFQFPTRTLWSTPGGGIESGESPDDAIRRELGEETGLVSPEIGPLLWTRLHIIPFIGGHWDGQREEYYLVRTAAFTPTPQHSWEQLNAEYVFELRWWTQAELDVARETFAPECLPELVRSLVRDGPPTEPIEVGV